MFISTFNYNKNGVILERKIEPLFKKGKDLKGFVAAYKISKGIAIKHTLLQFGIIDLSTKNEKQRYRVYHNQIVNGSNRLISKIVKPIFRKYMEDYSNKILNYKE